MKYAVEIRSGAMIYIPRSIRTVSAIQKFIVGGIHKKHGHHKSLPFFKQGKYHKNQNKRYQAAFLYSLLSIHCIKWVSYI
jgi:hypothetical protein